MAYLLLLGMKSWWRFIVVGLVSLSLILSGRNLTAQVAPESLVRQAQQKYDLGRSRQAIRLLQQAENIYRSRQQKLPQAQVLSLTSLVRQQQHNWAAARTNLHQSLTLIESIPASTDKVRVEAQIENTQGHYWFATGQYSQALVSWQQAEQLYRQLEDETGTSGTLLGQAEALEKLGFYQRACDRSLRILGSELRCRELQSDSIAVLIAQTPLDRLSLDSLLAVGNNLLLMGKLSLARQLIQASQNKVEGRARLSFATQAKTTLSLGNVNRAIALQALELDNSDSFRHHSQQAIKYFQQLGRAPQGSVDRTYQLGAKLNELSLYVVSQQWSKARTCANQIRLQNSDSPAARLKFANSLVLLQRKGLKLNYSASEIADLYLQVISLTRRAGDRRLESYAWGYLGEYYSQNQLYQKPEDTPQTMLERALVLAQSARAPEIAYRWQWQLGKIYRQQGFKTKAIASYQAALTNLNSLRSDLATLEQEVQYEFKEQIEPVYRELADLLLVDSPSARDLALARDVIEALQVAELDNYFQDACLTYDTQTIDRLDRSAAIIYTIVLPDRLEVIMAMADRDTSNLTFYHHHSSVTQTQLEDTVKQLRDYITEPDRTRQVQQVSAQIYDWLIRPLAANLAIQQPTTVVFVLDGILQTIPMAALYDGKQYLIEQHAIALTPGLRLLNYQANSRPLSVLAGGINRSQIVGKQKFSALNGVYSELAIASRQENDLLLNRQFTPERLLDQLNKTSASVLHLATHAQFSSNPQTTFLLMWQKLLNIKEFSSIIQNRFKIGSNPIKLLVLSACDTASGDRRAALGLAGVAVRSGALSTVATLWRINDDSTSELMKHFYQHLDRSGKAEALRQAQLELWQTADKDWRVPAFWSAYVIIGDWQ